MDLETYLDVLFDLNVDTPFQYLCPSELVPRAIPGTRVLAPLRGRARMGVILASGPAARVSKVLPVLEIPDEEPFIDPHLMSLIGWIADHYLASLGISFRAAVPGSVLRHTASSGRAAPRRILVTLASPPPAGGKPLSPRQQALLARLARDGAVLASLLLDETGADLRMLRRLESRGFINLRPAKGDEDAGGPGPPAWPVQLADSQMEASSVIGAALDSAAFRRILLQGPPGCGKLETFFHSLKAHLPPDKQVLILAPELSLTLPIMRRIGRLFPGQVSLYHGRLTDKQQREEWRRIRSGEARVVVGSRAAVFAPLPRPGIIYVAEEQETSYKAEETPRYHARDAAVARAKLARIPVILSSAAPSLETLAAARLKGAVHLILPPFGRKGRKTTTTAVDLRMEKDARAVILSGQLRYALRHTLAKGGKTILFVNRRGLAAAAFCASCFYTPRCPRCSTALSYHDEGGLLLCRLCGHRESLFLTCPRCGGSVVRPGSPGTRGVAGEIGRLFPAARTGILDRDSIARKGELERIIRDFSSGALDILIGTQLLARGFDWPDVSLVGVVDADSLLHRPDFRAAERTFQLLTELAGRARGGRLSGRVVIQTRFPDHYAIRAAVQGRPDLFYPQEEAIRREVGFPPYRSLVLLTVEDEAKEEAAARAGHLRKALDAALDVRRRDDPAAESPEVLGPHAAPLWRRRQRHRQQLLVKGPTSEAARRLVSEALALAGQPGRRDGWKITVDVDPVDFL